jgi:hypothetical protein
MPAAKGDHADRVRVFLKQRPLTAPFLFLSQHNGRQFDNQVAVVILYVGHFTMSAYMEKLVLSHELQRNHPAQRARATSNVPLGRDFYSAMVEHISGFFGCFHRVNCAQTPGSLRSPARGFPGERVIARRDLGAPSIGND